MQATIQRLNNHLADIARRYPNCYRLLEEARHLRGKELPDWPDWCFVPVAACYAVVTGGKDPPRDLESVIDIGLMHAFVSWRLTQGIYRFDPDLYQELASTPFTGQIPAEILFNLPEWCVYLDLDESFAQGVWVTLEHDGNDGHAELRLLFDTPAGIYPFAIHLVGTLEDGVQAATEFARKHMQDAGRLARDPKTIDKADRFDRFFESTSSLLENLGKVVSLVLYLCSEQPDLVDATQKRSKPTKPRPTKTKKGERLFPAQKPTVWQTGYRLGEFLRRSQEIHTLHQGGTHASPAPHVRRAHWHTFWTGPKSEPTGRSAIIKWIPPIPVGFEWEETEGKLIPVLKRVRGKI